MRSVNEQALSSYWNRIYVRDFVKIPNKLLYMVAGGLDRELSTLSANCRCFAGTMPNSVRNILFTIMLLKLDTAVPDSVLSSSLEVDDDDMEADARQLYDKLLAYNDSVSDEISSLGMSLYAQEHMRMIDAAGELFQITREQAKAEYDSKLILRINLDIISSMSGYERRQIFFALDWLKEADIIYDYSASTSVWDTDAIFLIRLNPDLWLVNMHNSYNYTEFTRDEIVCLSGALLPKDIVTYTLEAHANNCSLHEYRMKIGRCGLSKSKNACKLALHIRYLFKHQKLTSIPLHQFKSLLAGYFDYPAIIERLFEEITDKVDLFRFSIVGGEVRFYNVVEDKVIAEKRKFDNSAKRQIHDLIKKLSNVYTDLSKAIMGESLIKLQRKARTHTIQCILDTITSVVPYMIDNGLFRWERDTDGEWWAQPIHSYILVASTNRFRYQS